MKDSYEEFIKRFGMNKDEFFEFGIKEIIFPDIERVRENWIDLKNRIKNKNEIFIRGYGRGGASTYLYSELYSDVFNYTNVKKDKSNNARPQAIIKQLTGLRRGKDIINYQVSHIFQKTHNIFMFEAPWNIIYTPKLYDPFTGHESKGEWPDKFKELLRKSAGERYSEFIKDFNSNISDIYYEEINTHIENTIDQLSDESEKKIYNRFLGDALKEFEKIVY